MENIGIFEVDCRQKAKKREGLSFVQRAAPFKDRIERIHKLAQENDFPLVFTTCCSNRLPTADDSRGALFVPMDSSRKDWLAKVKSKSLIYIEKKNWGTPIGNTHHCAWDMFRHNSNAHMLFEKLGITHWYVYGVGIDLCIPSAIRGLLGAGCKATILNDIMVNNVNGNKQTAVKMLENLRELGVENIHSEEFFKELQRTVA